MAAALTVEHVAELAKQGKKRIAVIAPAFSADCIETLEEINGEIREAFEHAGGESFTYIPCLNDDDAHITALSAVIEDNLAGWLPRADNLSRSGTSRDRQENQWVTDPRSRSLTLCSIMRTRKTACLFSRPFCTPVTASGTNRAESPARA